MTPAGDDTSAEATRPTGFTWRISNISSSITTTRFLEILNDLPCPNGTTDGQNNVDGWSFAPSAASADTEKSRTATVTFRSVPVQFQLILNTILVGSTLPIMVDSHFHGLTPLNNPDGQPTVDIVAVTGLAGHAFGSWKSRSDYTMWLRDFLPAHVPNARILTYGYDSALVKNSSNASIREFSQNFLEALKTARARKTEQCRPIILIGHSLGGLVIKQTQALTEAAGSPNEEDRFLLKSCYSLLFFSVPNKGLEVTSFKTMVKGQPNARLIADLEMSSGFLHILDRLWRRVQLEIMDIRVVSIYETRPSPTVEETPTGWKLTGPTIVMVSRDSAIDATPRENPNDTFSTDANHSNIVKFGSSTCQDYLNVSARIVGLVENAPSVISKRFERRGEHLSQAQLKFVRAFGPPDYSETRDQVNDPTSGTIKWFLKCKDFVSWDLKDESSILWIKGSPGQGKSVLAKFLLEYLESKRLGRGQQQYRESTVIYFFFYNQDQKHRTVSSILRSLIHQLLMTCGGSAFDRILSKREFSRDPTSIVESNVIMWSFLADILSDPAFSTIYCVIDALDECEDHKTAFLSQIKKVFQKRQNQPLLKLVVTSRPTRDISNEFGRFRFIQLQATDEDLRLFVEHQVSTLPNDFTVAMREEASKRLLEKAEQTLLWVSIVVGKLKKLSFPSISSVRKTIENSPKELDQLYSEIVEQILNQPGDTLAEILIWITYANRPLTLKELQAAIATKLHCKSKGETEQHMIEFTEETITNNMGTLVKIMGETVHLIHQSAKDFLIKKQQLHKTIPCNGKTPDIHLARVCMTYLNFTNFTAEFEWDHTTLQKQGMENEYPLLKYAFTNWHNHIENGKDVSEDAGNLYELITPDSRIVQLWFRKYIVDRYQTPRCPLHVAIGSGCLWLVEYVINGNDPRIPSTIPPDTLERAADLRTPSIFEFLFNIPDCISTTRVLEVAARNQYCGTEMVKIVLNMDHDIKITEGVLKAAAQNQLCGAKVLEALLSKDTDIKISEGVLKQAAANERGVAVMKVLLDRDNCEITERVLEVAAGNPVGGPKVLEVLLIRAANISITEGVLVAAAANRFRGAEVMKVLAGHPGFTITGEVLIAASRNMFGGVEVVKVLLATSTNIEVTEQTLVAMMGGSGILEILKVLLGSDLNIKITEQVLTAAAHLNDPKVMKVLLTRDPKIKITEQVLVMAAVNGRSPEVMEMLLARDPKIKITECVLVAAVEGYSSSEVMKVLLTRDPNTKITERVLMAAAKKDSSKMLEMLLARDPNAEVLVAVAKKSSPEMMKVLLARDPNTKITEHVLVEAVKKDSPKMLEVLLARDPNIKVTECVLVAAAQNQFCGAQLVTVLHHRDLDLDIEQLGSW